MIVGLTIACALACGALVVAEWRRLSRLRAAAKVIASLAFLGVGWIASRHQPAPASWIVAGLALGVAGDIALLGRGKRAFLVGLGAFLLGHLAYVAAITELAPPHTWAGPLALAPIAVAAIALHQLWPRLGAMRVPVIAYVVVIVAMVIGALAVGREPLVAGAVLFFASDLAVARDKFVASTFVNKAWGLPAYYAGQLLIAWSLCV
jgi:uncharacterized membrane protein YhhN